MSEQDFSVEEQEEWDSLCKEAEQEYYKEEEDKFMFFLLAKRINE